MKIEPNFVSRVRYKVSQAFSRTSVALRDHRSRRTPK